MFAGLFSALPCTSQWTWNNLPAPQSAAFWELPLSKCRIIQPDNVTSTESGRKACSQWMCTLIGNFRAFWPRVKRQRAMTRCSCHVLLNDQNKGKKELCLIFFPVVKQNSTLLWTEMLWKGRVFGCLRNHRSCQMLSGFRYYHTANALSDASGQNI